MKAKLFPGAALALLLAAPLAAQPSEAMLKCARIVEDAERVACYDRLVAEMSAQGKRLVAERQAATDKLTAEREAASKAEAEARQRARFGGEGLGLAEDGTRLEALDSKLTETFVDSSRLMVFLLENGQVWRQTEGVFRYNPKPGTELSIKRSRLGGYTMTFPGTNRVVNVKRIR